MEYIKKIKEHYMIDFNNDYEVHHIDENRKNNSIDNLMILPKETHQKYHYYKEIIKNKTLITEIKSILDNGCKHNSFLIENMNNFIKVYEECNKFKDFKMFLDGNIPNIHNIEVIYKK